MRLVSLLFLIFTVPVCTAQERAFYIGAFQSNEAMTLASMEATQGIQAKERQVYRNNFFGKLVNEFRHDSFTTYFANNVPEQKNFIPANIDVISENTIRVNYFNPKSGNTTRELTFVNGCYHIPVTEWQFKEYFCRTSNNANTGTNSGTSSFKVRIDKVELLEGLILKGLALTGEVSVGCIANNDWFSIYRNGKLLRTADVRLLHIANLKEGEVFDGKADKGDYATFYIPDGKTGEVQIGDIIISNNTSCTIKH